MHISVSLQLNMDWHSLSKSFTDAFREEKETPTHYGNVLKLVNFGVGACTEGEYLSLCLLFLSLDDLPPVCWLRVL